MSSLDNITNSLLIKDTRRLTKEETESQIELYLNHITSNQNPPAEKQSLIGFFSLVQNAIRTREEEEGVPKDKRLLVLASDPPEQIDTEAITFYLKSRSPGQWNRGSAGQARIKEVIAHVRDIRHHPEHLGEKLVTMGKVYDNQIGFCIYAKDDKTALRRVLWLESVMESFRWYFRVHGSRQVSENGG